MELYQLRYFLAVAQSQHMTRSAEQTHIAQSAFSRAIHLLEQELGVPLFVTKGRNIVLTEYGKFLQKKVSPIVEQLDALPEELQTMAKHENNTIHMNVLAASALITEAIIAYEKEHPNLRFTLMQNAESEVYDISVTTRLIYQGSAASAHDCFVCSEKIYLAVPAKHPLAQKHAIHLCEAANEGFICLMGSKNLRWICDQFCFHAGFQPHILFESDSPAAVRNAIAADLGVGFWPQFSWGKLETEDVKLLEIDTPICQREILCNMKRNKANSSAAETFFRYLQNYFLQKIAL